MNSRVPVVDNNDKPLMPTKASRARRMVRDGKAIGQWSDLGVWYIKLVAEPSGDATQPIVAGVDPGKSYSGVGVQSGKHTLFRGHLVLPFNRVRARMDQRRLLRRGRRGRRIDRSIPFAQRSHRQKRFDNRRGNKLPPSIRAARQLELRVITELSKLFPIVAIGYERVAARTKKGCNFSPVQVGQDWAIEQMSKLAPVYQIKGWQKDGNGTSQIRKFLGLEKDKTNKSHAEPETHSVDGVAIASSYFVKFKSCHRFKEDGKSCFGSVGITPSVFKIITRFGAVKRGKQYGFYRRQLHFEVPAKGDVRKRKGGTVTPWLFRIGDFVSSTKGKAAVTGYIGGYSEPNKVVSIYDWQWKRIGQFLVGKTKLLRRSNGLCVA
ncbi:hypothetical protein S7335_1238 [Synechococcus sp. PCC 7335]|uniref:RRXRR domain-containing protein n=1 Tax=Synechococcus sp. (strain ATCC 29403 / PCC 7335) TaxID=91464 RepID=UPI00017EE4C5|nr:RRXRR domain-containing protein [Synechococcus sp. PCC 7335]EDX82534.1 hypothetical protein S7335_1238 [Synechococcus sp. PCC 7335]